MRACIFFIFLMMMGRKPSVLTSGTRRRSISSAVSIMLEENGNSFSGNEETQPKALGSVHIPYSIQNPGRKVMSGKRSLTAILHSNQMSSTDR